VRLVLEKHDHQNNTNQPTMITAVARFLAGCAKMPFSLGWNTIKLSIGMYTLYWAARIALILALVATVVLLKIFAPYALPGVILKPKIPALLFRMF
jgi:hypothetical protein